MGWGSSNKWGRKPTHKRGPVVWSDNSGAKPAPFMQVMPKYEETRAIAPEHQDHLYVGAMWTAKIAMNTGAQVVGCKYPPLVPTYWEQDKALVKLNSIMIYAGIVRIDEREANGRIVSVPRHSFVAGEGRYIITDFSHVTPVT